MAENTKILFYPDKLRHHNKLRYVLEYLGIEWTHNVNDNWGTAVFWDFKTTRDKAFELDKYGRKVINYDCVSAGKKYINLIFEKVFGYSFMVDPTEFKGSCLAKSIEQAAHNGKITQCPIDVADNTLIYQKIIDTRINERYIRDVRVPVFKDQIGCLFSKIRPFNQLVGGVNRRGHKIIYHSSPDELLSKEEQGLLIEFCKQIPVEYCELDVLRSNFDGKIYVVDMNNTPSGGLFLVMGLEKRVTKKAIKEYSEMFYEKFLK